MFIYQGNLKCSGSCRTGDLERVQITLFFFSVLLPLVTVPLWNSLVLIPVIVSHACFGQEDENHKDLLFHQEARAMQFLLEVDWVRSSHFISNGREHYTSFQLLIHKPWHRHLCVRSLLHATHHRPWCLSQTKVSGAFGWMNKWINDSYCLETGEYSLWITISTLPYLQRNIQMSKKMS